ncbi:MAG: hypothetical protein ABW277_14750 [Longimicrobiaceae bacterium]
MSAPLLRRPARPWAAAALLALAACGTEIVLTPSRHPGYLLLEFVDGAGACVRGVQMEFAIPGETPYRVTNASFCETGAVGRPGEWTVALTPPAGYALAPGQANPLVVRVRRDETQRLRVVLAAAGR